MTIIKKLEEILKEVKKISNKIGNEACELSDLEKQYKEYKFLADARGTKLLADEGLLDEYNKFMSNAEEILFKESDDFYRSISLPKPSPALEKFKDKFNKFL